MKLLDQNTSQVFHVPELVLMEQASMAFVQKLLVLKQNKLSTALIACGSGNNGGDGLAIARLLREQGILYSYGWQERKKGTGPVRPMMFKNRSAVPITFRSCKRRKFPQGRHPMMWSLMPCLEPVCPGKYPEHLQTILTCSINCLDGKLPWILLPESVPMMEQCLARLFVQTTQLHFHLEKGTVSVAGQ